MTTPNNFFYPSKTMWVWYIILIILFIGIHLLCWHVKTKSQRHYLNMEINRSRYMFEQDYWRYELFKLNITAIPIIGLIIYKILDKNNEE